MTTYNTGNAVGSSDPRDLYDNAENLDVLTVSTEETAHDDRLGKSRRTWHGIEQAFQEFLLNSGYQPIDEPYATGIEVTERNQVILADNEYWRLSASTELPYTTDGSGMPEGAAFVSVGDAALRQQLGGAISSGQGALLVGGSALYLNDIDSLQSLATNGVSNGQLIHITTTGRKGRFAWVSGDQSEKISDDTEMGIWVAPSSDATGSSGAWKRSDTNIMTPEMFGAEGDGVTDDTPAFQAMGLSEASIIFCSKGKTYLLTDQVDITKEKEINLNGATLQFNLTTQVAGIFVKADNVEIHNGNVFVEGSGGAETGGGGHSLNCITSGNQTTGAGWSGLHVHHVSVTTNRTDAGAHIGLLGECHDFNFHDIDIPDNDVCRNIIGVEWGGNSPDPTGHPHNGVIRNINAGSITTNSASYIVYLSSAFNITIENIFAKEAYGVIAVFTGDRSNDAAPAEYKELVGTGFTINNVSCKNVRQYGLRFYGKGSGSPNTLPLKTTVTNATLEGSLIASSFGVLLEFVEGVNFHNCDIGSFQIGIVTAANVRRLRVIGGSIFGNEQHGASIGSSGGGVKDISFERVRIRNNNQSSGTNAGLKFANCYLFRVIGCDFGGDSEAQYYSIRIESTAYNGRLKDNHTFELGGGAAYANGGSSDYDLNTCGENNTTEAGLVGFGGAPIYQIDWLGRKQFLISGGSAPSSGNWKGGDTCFYSSPSPGGYIGSVYTASGWKGFGEIQS